MILTFFPLNHARKRQIPAPSGRDLAFFFFGKKTSLTCFESRFEGENLANNI
ncbi:hypothetical protein HanIR_Chr04g0183661 [Helianthus annuus]|nr:hypothetical protein HanIR_Chr04g0183661 [Helianthus annuus]